MSDGGAFGSVPVIGNVFEILQSVGAILWRLRRDLIADAIFRVDPKRGEVWKLPLSDTNRFCAIS